MKTTSCISFSDILLFFTPHIFTPHLFTPHLSPPKKILIDWSQVLQKEKKTCISSQDLLHKVYPLNEVAVQIFGYLHKKITDFQLNFLTIQCS
jgi:hypothetical protein